MRSGIELGETPCGVTISAPNYKCKHVEFNFTFDFDFASSRPRLQLTFLLRGRKTATELCRWGPISRNYL